MQRSYQPSVGIAGAGLMGRWHAAFAVAGGASVDAVLDIDERAARALADRHRARPYRDLDRMLSETNLDVLHVCTPADTHVAFAEAALRSRCHVLVEKPMTQVADDTVHLIDQARSARRLICPVHQFVFQRGVRAAVASRSRLGRLLGIDLSFHSAGAEGMDAAGRDVVVADILPHPLSIVHTLLPEGCAVENWSVLHPGPGEFLAAGVQKDVIVSVDISMSRRPTVAELRLSGTNGTLYANLYHGYGFFFEGTVSRPRKIANPVYWSLRNAAAASINLVRRAARRETAYPGLRALLDGFYRAAYGATSHPIGYDAVLAVARERDRLVRLGGLMTV